MDATTKPGRIELEGAVNVRDVGGLPIGDGRTVLPGRLIRSDNLQGLTESDVRVLVDERGVRGVVDLRTGMEVESEGPGPMTHEPAVQIHHISLVPEAGTNTDVAADQKGGRRRQLIVHEEHTARLREGDGAASIYLAYLEDNPDAVVGALRVIAQTDGAVVVHCAAGKDRTGVVVALALSEVGVDREAVVADYALTSERLKEIFFRLGASPTYFEDVSAVEIDRHDAKPAYIRRFLELVDQRFGGPSAWLRDHGWTDDDAGALESRLLG